jgi:hypothetical protein
VQVSSSGVPFPSTVSCVRDRVSEAPFYRATASALPHLLLWAVAIESVEFSWGERAAL